MCGISLLPEVIGAYRDPQMILREPASKCNRRHHPDALL